jgi:GrpB-like predicted nucleotidyltransferase (UPF0157 family)
VVIEIVSYDPAWPQRFAELGADLRRALGDVALRIDHIGSTAVPGLAAKPIIDVQVSVASFEPLAAFKAPELLIDEPGSDGGQLMSTRATLREAGLPTHETPAARPWRQRHSFVARRCFCLVATATVLGVRSDGARTRRRRAPNAQEPTDPADWSVCSSSAAKARQVPQGMCACRSSAEVGFSTQSFNRAPIA